MLESQLLSITRERDGERGRGREKEGEKERSMDFPVWSGFTGQREFSGVQIPIPSSAITKRMNSLEFNK